ncbi:hypothetical protein [Aliivibrio fischeri]|uniref:hypothetical protein n=1 Tax=Aliivibrio fischeri TaxID=668 RepID=UPI0037350193
MSKSNQDLLNLKKITIPTLGGRSAIDLNFNDECITVINSNGNKTVFSWHDLSAVESFCKQKGYNKAGTNYNPMNGGIFPKDYPKHRNTLSLVSLAHYKVGSHPFC